MTRIRVALPPSVVCIAGTDPTLKIKDQQTGEVATDRETGASLYTVTVMLMQDGRAEVLKITVPETGLAAGLKPGVMVRPMELFATPWVRIFNGQVSDGVAYRAARLELVTVEAVQ
ncbi:putative replication activator protein [Actinacidiphila reveromycinica]|uniref:Putative replication activator protein n=2 Tax=Actinacidiphila reveromycinica TaxID=659352 RepID=A0A7U3VQU9_9ACTN|nr:putative replication activator protein [Streptomyces sp. SN-593]